MSDTVTAPATPTVTVTALDAGDLDIEVGWHTEWPGSVAMKTPAPEQIYILRPDQADHLGRLLIDHAQKAADAYRNWRPDAGGGEGE